MRIALIASSYLPRPGGLERHVHELAAGLAARGVGVEVLTQDPPRPLPPASDFEGFVVRRLGGSRGNGYLGIAPGLWEHLRRRARSFDLVDLHCAHPSLGLAVIRARPSKVVFTPHATVGRLVRWPYAQVTRAVIEHAAHIVCTAEVERELLCDTFPGAAERISVIRPGIDVTGISAATPFDCPGNVVVIVDRLEREKRIDRAIAAMASLDTSFRLAVVGDGSMRQRLLAHAADLRVSSRIELVGQLPDAEVYRWLRTGRVVLSLAEERSSALQIAEAVQAGAPVVASDIPVHREAASYLDDRLVALVSPYGSPLEIADRVAEAAELCLPASTRPPAWTWDDVVQETLVLYQTVLERTRQLATARN
jgi:glycosyltransferase involved in cell wall biosynthesis